MSNHRHVHADCMIALAEDSRRKTFSSQPRNSCWILAVSPAWHANRSYQVREPDGTVVKTTHPRPKKRYVMVDGVKLPAPLEEAPEDGFVWFAKCVAVLGWTAGAMDAYPCREEVRRLIAEQNAYATKEDAEAWIEFYRTKREVIEE